MLRSEQVFRALADPNRRRILAILKAGSRSAPKRFAQERRGQSIVYSLNTTVFEDVASALAEMFHIERPDGGVS